MIKFRPIVYAITDLRAFQYSGASAIEEGKFCSALASTDLNTFIVGAFSGVSPATIPIASGGGTTTLHDVKAYFPVYREEPDIENVSATINNGIDVIGFGMKSGNEFEVDQSVTESGFATTFAQLDKVALGSNGFITPAAKKNATTLIVGICTGTFNGKIRVRVI